MKFLTTIIIFFTFGSFINLNGQKFNITENLLQIDVNNIFKPASRIQMINALNYKNYYYVIFEETMMYRMGNSQKHLLKFDKFGKILFTVELPQQFSSSYYLDFFVQDDNIFIQNQNNVRYIFDIKTNKFSETTKGNDLVFENNKYKVMYKSFGEWGQATWFINKKDKSEYFTSLNGQDVNFFNNKFYVTNVSSIWEIINPKYLDKCEPNQRYDFINEKEFGMFTSYDYSKGICSIYKDSQYDSYDYEYSVKDLKYTFITSFVLNNHFYQITQLKDRTVISEIEKDTVGIVHKFNEKYNFFSWHNQFRNTKNKEKFLKFKNGYNSFGFFEVLNNKIDISKVEYKYDTLQYIKSDNIIGLISNLSTKSEISKNEVIDFEGKTEGVDIKIYRKDINHNSYYPRKFKKVDIETIEFVKSENEYLTQDIEYLIKKENQNLKAIFIDWDKTNYFNSTGKKYYPIRSKNKDESDKYFKLKYSEIKDYLNKMGEKIDVQIKPNKGNYDSWILNGWRFNLYGISEKDIYGVRFFICRQVDFNKDE